MEGNHYFPGLLFLIRLQQQSRLGKRKKHMQREYSCFAFFFLYAYHVSRLQLKFHLIAPQANMNYTLTPQNLDAARKREINLILVIRLAAGN